MSDWKKMIQDAKELFDTGAITQEQFELMRDEAFALRSQSSTIPPSINLDDLGTSIHSGEVPSTPPSGLDELGTLISGPNTMTSNVLNNMGTMMGNIVGQTVGSYQLISLIGQGGMGSVFRGRHKDQQVAETRGDVAIKMIHPSLAKDPDFKRRFVKEGLFGMKLSHPNIANVIDVVDDDGRLALLMDFVEGQELKESITPNGLPVDEVVRLLKPIASALDYLHEKGIVHRDMKPANVRVKPDGTPVILDFGIAKDTNETDSGMTQTGTAMGTQTYMAPEQMDAKRVTGAADQYALAMMAYQMLSGKLPWDESLPSARITMVKMTGDLNTLETVTSVSRFVNRVVMKGLSLNPKDRYDSCVTFAAEIEKFSLEEQLVLDEQPVRSVEYPEVERPNLDKRVQGPQDTDIQTYGQKSNAGCGKWILALVALWAVKCGYQIYKASTSKGQYRVRCEGFKTHGSEYDYSYIDLSYRLNGEVNYSKIIFDISGGLSGVRLSSIKHKSDLPIRFLTLEGSALVGTLKNGRAINSIHMDDWVEPKIVTLSLKDPFIPEATGMPILANYGSSTDKLYCEKK